MRCAGCDQEILPDDVYVKGREQVTIPLSLAGEDGFIHKPGRSYVVHCGCWKVFARKWQCVVEPDYTP